MKKSADFRNVNKESENIKNIREGVIDVTDGRSFNLGSRNLASKGQRGVAMFVVVVLCLILLVLGSSLIWVMVNEAKQSENYVDSTTALFMAEAGVEQALWEFRTDIDGQSSGGMGWYEKVVESDGFSETITTFDTFKQDMESRIPGSRVNNIILSVDMPQPMASPTGEMEATQRYGFVTVQSSATYNGVTRTVTVKKPMVAGIFGPAFDYSFFVKEKAYLSYNELSDFVIKGDKLFMNHANVEFSDALVDKFRDKGELQFMDAGYGLGLDVFQNPIDNLLGKETFSGNDLTGVDEISGEVYRRYYNYEGLQLGSFYGIPYPKWPWKEVDEDTEEYASNVIQKKMETIPDLFDEDQYRKAAESCNQVYDQSSDFDNVGYEMFSLLGTDFRETNYNHVKTYYGWGSWKNKKPKWYEFWKNPTKASDSSTPIELNGFEFVDGDVYIEGYYKGKGVIVATGNIYIGGDLIKWVPTDAGATDKEIEEANKKSSIQLISLASDSGATGVVYKPHHDKEWSRYPKLTRDLDPLIQAYIYSKNGIRMETDSIMENLTNLTIEGNLVCDELNWKDKVHDVVIQPDEYEEEMKKNLASVYQAHLRNYFIVILRKVEKWQVTSEKI